MSAAGDVSAVCFCGGVPQGAMGAVVVAVTPLSIEVLGGGKAKWGRFPSVSSPKIPRVSSTIPFADFHQTVGAFGSQLQNVCVVFCRFGLCHHPAEYHCWARGHEVRENPSERSWDLVVLLSIPA